MQRSDPTLPKYKAIANAILAEVERGTWRSGDRLPSEESLARSYDASLGTMQRALRELVDMGMVERHHGSGTFIAGARAKEQQLLHFRFRAEGSKSLLPVYFRVTDISETEDQGPWAAFLDDPEGRFIKVSRIVTVNDEFDIFSEVYLQGSRFAGLLDLPPVELNGVSIRDLLAEHFNAPTLTADQSILCQALPPRVTRLIDVPAGQMGIVWYIAGRTYRDLPLTWQRIYVPPSDRPIEFSSHQTPG